MQKATNALDNYSGLKVKWVGKDKDRFIAVGQKSTGELTEIDTSGTVIGQQHRVDAERFVKMYASGIAAAFNLGKAGQKVFLLIYQEISKKKDTDTIYIPYSEEMGISRATYYKGIKECIEEELIAQSQAPGFYFTNPCCFFNGDRLTFVTQYIKTQNTISNNDEG